MRDQDQRMLTESDFKVMAQEEATRVQQLDEKGLCRNCEDTPKNPHINAPLCLDCFQDRAYNRCHSDGCPNSSDGSYGRAPLCAAHMSEAAYGEYQSYLQMQSKIENGEYEDENEKKLLQRDADRIKGRIESAQNEVDQLFPDNYELFG